MSSILSAGLTTPFTAPSAFFWCLLSAATVVDYFKTRQLSAVTRGASVRRGIRWVVAAYALDSVLLLMLSLAGNSTFSDVVDFASLLLEDFAEAAFLLLLLAVAAGVGVARPGPGPHRGKVLLVPLVYLVTTLAVDLAEEYVSIKDGWLADLEGGAAGVLTGSAATLFNACQVISLVALLLAWFMVFDVAQATRRELEPQAEGIVGTTAAAGAGGRGAAASNGAGLGHSVDLPAEVVLAAAERGDHALQETYAEVSRDAGGDEPKSAADAVATRAKLTLLKRFLAGATLYVLARAAAIVVPLAVLPAPSQADAATTAASVAEDAVRLLFLAALALIFRAREDSPYLMVGGGIGGGGDDGTGVGAAGLTTELGVLRGGGGGEDDDDEERGPSRLPPPRAPLFAGQQRSDAPPPPPKEQQQHKAPAVALAPPPRSPAGLGLSPSSSSSARPAAAATTAGAAMAAAAAAAGTAAGVAGAARAAGVDARFALDDDSDSDYGGEAGGSEKAVAAPAAAAAAPPPRRDSTEEIPL